MLYGNYEVLTAGFKGPWTGHHLTYVRVSPKHTSPPIGIGALANPQNTLAGHYLLATNTLTRLLTAVHPRHSLRFIRRTWLPRNQRV